MATTSKGVRRDAFIKSVRPDPKSTEELVLLQGYIGDSDLDGHVRVYSDAALSDFIEVPEQGILYCDPVEPAEDPLGGSRLWVKKTTVFTAGDPRHANRIKSSFLEGDLVKAFGNQGGKVPTVVAKEIQQSQVAGCFPAPSKFLPGCNYITDVLPCPNQSLLGDKSLCAPPCGRITTGCPSWRFTCNPNCRLTRVEALCPTGGQRYCVLCNQGTVAQFALVSVRCPDPAIETMVVNPIAQGNYGYVAYTGGFNPYMTGY